VGGKCPADFEPYFSNSCHKWMHSALVEIHSVTSEIWHRIKILKERRKKVKTTAVKYKPFGTAMSCRIITMHILSTIFQLHLYVLLLLLPFDLGIHLFIGGMHWRQLQSMVPVASFFLESPTNSLGKERCSLYSGCLKPASVNEANNHLFAHALWLSICHNDYSKVLQWAWL